MMVVMMDEMHLINIKIHYWLSDRHKVYDIFILNFRGVDVTLHLLWIVDNEGITYLCWNAT